MIELTTVRQILDQSPNESEFQSLRADMPPGIMGPDFHLQNDVPEPGKVTIDSTFWTAEMAQQYIEYVKTKYTPLQIFIV